MSLQVPTCLRRRGGSVLLFRVALCNFSRAQHVFWLVFKRGRALLSTVVGCYVEKAHLAQMHAVVPEISAMALQSHVWKKSSKDVEAAALNAIANGRAFGCRLTICKKLRDVDFSANSRS